MQNVNKLTLALKIAEALLKHRGEITLDDIKAIPFIEDTREAEMIATFLSNKFNAQIFTRRISQSGIASWEQIITINKGE